MRIFCSICGEDLKKTGYTYSIEVDKKKKWTIDLCEVCEMELFSKMTEQFILEQKFRMDIPCIANHWMSQEELMKLRKEDEVKGKGTEKEKTQRANGNAV